MAAFLKFRACYSALLLLMLLTDSNGDSLSPECWDAFEDLQQVVKDVSSKLEGNAVAQQETINKMVARIASLETENSEVKISIAALQSAHTNLKNNPVPVGFLYTEYPDSHDPSIIWPEVTWLDVTSQYGGLFLRAEGGSSGAFGTIQSESSPKISKAEFNISANGVLETKFLQLGTGWNGYDEHRGPTDVEKHSHNLKFFTTADPVTPRNTAIRIWKRIA